MSFATNLKISMKSKKITANEIAEKIGVTRGTVTHWSNGVRSPNPEQITLLSKILNVDVSELFENDDENKIKVRTIPLIGLASCGVPQSYALDGYEPVVVSADIYKDGMYAVRAEGDSMSPKINHGNIVYCLANETIDNGHIIHYTLNGESGIKKYKINEKGTIITLIPLNSKYDVVTIHENDPHSLKMAKVVGVVDTDF